MLNQDLCGRSCCAELTFCKSELAILFLFLNESDFAMTQQVKFLFCNNFAMTQQVKLELVDITREMDCQWFLNNPTHVLHFRRPTGGDLYFPADANAVCVIDADENWWMKLGVVTAPLSRVAEVIDGASYDDAEFIPLVKEFLRGCTLGPNGPELWPQIKRQAKVKRRQVN